MTKPNQPPEVIYYLSKDIGRLLNEYLNQPTPDYEKLHEAILMTLNQDYYRKKLLFIDKLKSQEEKKNNPDYYTKFGKEWYYEAQVYYAGVLGRRLELANTLVDKPTNMHQLLIAYCQLTQNPCWHDSDIVRSQETEQKIGGFFIDIAKKLTLQRQKLAGNYCANAKSRNSQYGAYWFKVEDYAAEVAEELSFWDVIETIPTPLNSAEERPLLLQKVLESLNTRYSLLRSSGLLPEEWLENKEISIPDLEEFKLLIKNAKELIETEKMEKQEAYERVFNELKAKSKFNKVMGFSNFYQFLSSRLSDRIFSNRLFSKYVSLDDEMENLGGKQNDEKNTEATEDHEYSDELAEFVEHSEEFNDVTRELCKRTMLEGLRFDDLMKDENFLKLVKKHRYYKNFPKKILREVLEEELEAILIKNNQEINHG